MRKAATIESERLLGGDGALHLRRAEILLLQGKVLADIAVHDPEGFGAIAEQAKAALAQNS